MAEETDAAPTSAPSAPSVPSVRASPAASEDRGPARRPSGAWERATRGIRARGKALRARPPAGSGWLMI